MARLSDDGSSRRGGRRQLARDRLGLRAPARRVNARAMLWWALRGLITAGSARLVLWLLDRELPRLSEQWWDPLVTVTYAVGFVLVVVLPPIRFQIQRWEVREESVFVRDGLLQICLRVIPIARVQAVASRRGPLEILLRLTTVIVTTASSMGPLYLVGLDRDEAIDIESGLADAAEATRGEAT